MQDVLTYVATNYKPSHNRSYPQEPNEKWGYWPDDKMVSPSDLTPDSVLLRIVTPRTNAVACKKPSRYRMPSKM